MQAHLRLAPTPSGYLHIGNAVNFAITAAYARKLDAKLSLRIDDLDSARVRGAYLNDIRDCLYWLLPDDGPSIWNQAYYQSHHLERYTEVLSGLTTQDLVFACSCTRKEIKEAQASTRGDVNDYPGLCLEKTISLEEENVNWRLRDGGFVVRQRNHRPAYQLASVVDDVDMGITHIVRGVDLHRSSEMQLVLAKAYPPLSAFAKTSFYHHQLLSNPEGDKLSKSDGADSIRSLVASGLRPKDVFWEAAQLLQVEPCGSLIELSERISLQNLCEMPAKTPEE